ncbi:hypothetical protein INR49_004641 [Caranx melampygus]|nr:hypothetical protein INR49_004641 [Caranx melampygus]
MHMLKATCCNKDIFGGADVVGEVHEADWVHHSGLNDLPARKDPPRHSVGLQPQLSEHLHGGHLSIQSVEVEAWDLPAVQQHTAHLHCLVDAIVTDSSIVVFDGLNDSGDLLRYLQLGQLDKLAQGLVTLERNKFKSS